MKKLILSIICMFFIFNGSFVRAEDEVKQEKLKLKGKTKLDFVYPDKIFPKSARWAEDEGYHVRKESESKILYKKGYGIFYAPIFCEISQEKDTVHLEAWVSPDIITRTITLFMLPKEMQLHSKGLRGMVPRRMGRNSVNDLLIDLGQETIK